MLAQASEAGDVMTAEDCQEAINTEDSDSIASARSVLGTDFYGLGKLPADPFTDCRVCGGAEWTDSAAEQSPHDDSRCTACDGSGVDS